MDPHSSGHVSPCRRAALPPTRSWGSTASESVTPASMSVVVTTWAGWSARSSMRRLMAPTTSSRSPAGSARTRVSTGRTSRRRARPSTSSGVYVDAPPTTVTFIGLLQETPCRDTGAVRPRRDTLTGRKETFFTVGGERYNAWDGGARRRALSHPCAAGSLFGGGLRGVLTRTRIGPPPRATDCHHPHGGSGEGDHDQPAEQAVVPGRV